MTRALLIAVVALALSGCGDSPPSTAPAGPPRDPKMFEKGAGPKAPGQPAPQKPG